MRWSIEHGMTVRRIGEGPELVWIHGLAEASTCFDKVLAHVPGWTHVLPDLPGYGRSVWPERALGLEELAGTLAAWLGERPPAPVIGHSMGGVLATLIAERAPVRAAINIEGNLSPGDCTFSGKVSTYSPAEFAARGIDEVRAWVYQLGESSPPIRGYVSAMTFASPEMFHRHAADLVAMSAREDLAPRFAQLRVPGLYVAGVPDGICEHSRRLLAQHRVRALELAPAGHWVYADQPQRFATELRAFLSET